MEKGKTSNTELDRLHKLLQNKNTAILPFAFFVDFTEQKVKEIKELLKNHDTVLFPIFHRCHWIAALVTKNPTISITLYDSAPAKFVHRELREKIKSVWHPFPSIFVDHKWPKQARGSDDCGVFCSLRFFLHVMEIDLSPNVLAKIPAAIPCLRKIFYLGTIGKTTYEKITQKIFEQIVCVEGGNSDDEQREVWREVILEDMLPNNLVHTLTLDLLFDDIRQELGTGEVYSVLATQFSKKKPTRVYPIIKPLFYASHFSLAISFREGEVTTYDSLHDYCVKLRDKNVRAFFGKNIRITHVFSGPQGHNECAFFTVLAARRALSLPYPPPTVDLRHLFLAPLLARYTQAGIQAAPESYVPASFTSEESVSAEESYVPASFGDAPVSITSHAECPTQDKLELEARQEEPFRPATTEQVRTVLQEARAGDRITVPWRTKEDTNWYVWTGTVIGNYNEKAQDVIVQWDKKLEHFAGLRRCNFPEHSWDHGDYVYACPTLQKPTTNSTTRKPTSAKEEQPNNTASRPYHEQHPSGSPQQKVSNRKVANQSRPPAHEPQQPQAHTDKPGGLSSLLCPGATAMKGSSLRNVYVYREAPTNGPPGVWQAVSEGTRKEQLRRLNELKAMPADLANAELAAAVVTLTQRMATARRWKPSTHLRMLSTTASALRDLPILTSETHGIDISNSATFKAALRTARRAVAETKSGHAVSLKFQDYMKARKRLRQNPTAQLYLTLMWALAARASDIDGLAREDVKVDKDGKLAVVFRRGKGAKFSGPYPVGTVMDQEGVELLQKQLARVSQRLFPSPQDQRNPVREALTATLSSLTLPSVRRGAAQHMATAGVPEEQIMRLTGHKRLDTLRRYLGYNEVLTTEGERAQTSAAVLTGGGVSEAQEIKAKWPPIGGRMTDGTRARKPPPSNEEVGHKAPSADDLEIDPKELYRMICEMKGVNVELPPEPWPLHLKNPTLVDIEKVKQLTMSDECREFLNQTLAYLKPETFASRMTSRSLKSTSLTREEIQEAIEKGKFEKIEMEEPLPPNTHGTNVFTCTEMKGRRRIITEPSLNACIDKHEIPKCRYATRLERRQHIRKGRYLFQIDFEAFYDAIPIPDNMKRLFVFRKGHEFFALKTLPTGARWSVAVAQALTWALCDFVVPEGTQVETLIDNVLVIGEIGAEAAFVEVVRELTKRMKSCNCQTDPSLTTIEQMTDEDILRESSHENTFLGENYVWHAESHERLVRNSVKTICKLTLATAKLERAVAATSGREPRSINGATYRSVASLIALILYAMHTINIMPSKAFFMLRVYRAIGVEVGKQGGNWDARMPFISEPGLREIQTLAKTLIANQLTKIPQSEVVTYNEADYDEIIFVDASHLGWAAIRITGTGTLIYQQQWVHTLIDRNPAAIQDGDDEQKLSFHHSAHAEPWAIRVLLTHLIASEKDFPTRKIALVTDHKAIPEAQRKTNNYGGIGRGFALNSLFQVANAVGRCYFFYIDGLCNPADHFSRHFDEQMTAGKIRVTHGAPSVPQLRETYCPLCNDNEGRPTWMK